MQKLSYKAKRAQFLSIVIVFGFLVTIEAGVAFLLSALLLPDGSLRLGVEAGLGLFHLGMLAFLFGPLFTAHRLDNNYLKLRYSFVFRIDIPLSAIASARPATDRPKRPLTFKADYLATSQEIQLAFSDQGLIRLELDQPRLIRVNFKNRPTKRLLINLDHPEILLKALDVKSVEGKPQYVVS